MVNVCPKCHRRYDDYLKYCSNGYCTGAKLIHDSMPRLPDITSKLRGEKADAFVDQIKLGRKAEQFKTLSKEQKGLSKALYKDKYTWRQRAKSYLPETPQWKEDEKSRRKNAKDNLKEASAKLSDIRGEALKDFSDKFKSKVAGVGIEVLICLIAIFFATIYGYFMLVIALFGAMGYFIFKKGPAKAMSKLMIIVFAALEFILIHQVNLIALGILWVGYFTLPTKYHPEDTAKRMEAWGRFIVGILLSFSIFFAFGGQWSSLLGSIQTPILFIALAFFATLPAIQRDSGGITIYAGIGKDYSKKTVGVTIFLILMTFAGISMFTGSTSWELEGGMLFMMVIFYIFSFIMGIMAGEEGRPAVGVMMMIFAIFIFSFQFTGAVGTEMFGAYWPTIENAGSSVFGPLGDALDSAAGGMEDAWTIMTCPACYMQQQAEKDAAKDSIAVNTVKSVELKNFKVINYGTGDSSIDPAIPLIGTIELRNEGEFEANNIRVKLKSLLLKDPTKVGGAYNSDPDCWSSNPSVENDRCSYTPMIKDECVFTSCYGADQEKGVVGELGVSLCTWTDDVTGSGEFKSLTFKCNSKSDVGVWASGTKSTLETYATINQCDCYCRAGTACELEEFEDFNDAGILIGQKKSIITVDSDGKPTCCNTLTQAKAVSCYNSCVGDNTYAVYSYADRFVTFDMDYQFDYNVEVKNDITIMDRDIYLEKLTNNDIRPKDIDSYYTGGPVKISLSIQNQPLRNGETSYATVSVINEGKGMVLNGDSNLTVMIPKDIISAVDILSQTRFGPEEVVQRDVFIDGIDYYVFETKLAVQNTNGVVDPLYGLEKDKLARFTFTFTGDIGQDVIEKTTNVIGEFSYTYSTNKKIDSPIIKAPLQ
ncbi:MAG: hypothetical protein KJ906_00855 [Nanoarchaeota archaeon]|nr:hypothetical protein [Nanoarchaeota archaeon]